MSWKKHFRLVNLPNSLPQSNSALPAKPANGGGAATGAKFSSYLPEVYAGHPNRLQRYQQYDDMDRDSTINSALDTIADFCTQSEEQNDQPFQIRYNESANETEVKIIKATLEKWTKLNDFRSRLWYMFRGVIKNGDQFFVRDPETKEWLWVDQYNVELVRVDESQGKKPLEYIIRNMDYNKAQKLATQNATNHGSVPNSLARGPVQGASGSTAFQMTGSGSSQASGNGVSQAQVVDANHVVHLSLSVGMDANWPFGASVLEAIFKTFKQKELLEDAVIIYRVQRAPERRIFKIDTGNMNPMMANAHIERIKNEIHQRRIPNRSGGGNNMADAAYNPLCLAMDTRIPLLDGRTLDLSQLVTEFQAGKENWVYSCDPITGQIVPGNISWAGVTRRDAQVIKLTFDNGKTLICTPDHKIPVLGHGFVEAQNLTAGDSLISLETRKQSQSSDSNSCHNQVYDHQSNKWVFVHRMVGEFFKKISKHQEFTFSPKYMGKEKIVVHHKNMDQFNNDPRNLTWMNASDYQAYHEFLTPQQKFKDSATCDKLEKNPVGDKAEEISGITSTQAMDLSNKPFKTSFKMLQRIVDTVKLHGTNKVGTAKLLKYDSVFLLEKKINNHSSDNSGNNKINYSLVSADNINQVITDFHYLNWKDLVKKIPQFNHKVVDIEWMIDTQDTGCITIDGQERWHNHHTFAIESGVFVKNSMMEDYFFAVTPEGRGSSVETLPGGEQTGEIGDLSFFDKKLQAGLRIPSAYLSSGETAASYNDGQVGSAMIQEYMFNKYCMRLQSLLAPVFDREFKLFLKDNGVQIEEDLFELMFNSPQNFTKYRQIELDSQQMAVYAQIADNLRLSERFKLKRFLNLTEEELLENERLWSEENPSKVPVSQESAQDDLGSVGIRSDVMDDSMDDALPGNPGDNSEPDKMDDNDETL